MRSDFDQDDNPVFEELKRNLGKDSKELKDLQALCMDQVKVRFKELCDDNAEVFNKDDEFQAKFQRALAVRKAPVWVAKMINSFGVSTQNIVDPVEVFEGLLPLTGNFKSSADLEAVRHCGTEMTAGNWGFEAGCDQCRKRITGTFFLPLWEVPFSLVLRMRQSAGSAGEEDTGGLRRQVVQRYPVLIALLCFALHCFACFSELCFALLALLCFALLALLRFALAFVLLCIASHCFALLCLLCIALRCFALHCFACFA